MLTEILKMQSSWEMLKNTDLPVIIYGTGDGADKVVDEFERLGIRLSGIIASDGFVRQRTFRGYTVKSLSDFERKSDNFIIAIGFGTSMDDVIDNIKAISQKHKVVVPCVPVYDSPIFNRSFITENKTNLENAYSFLADEISKEVFLDVIRFELTGELKYLFRSETSKDEAFTSILKLGKEECYLDLGAYRGDTVNEFLHYTSGEYSRITALEPDRKTFIKLQENTSHLENCKVFNNGIWSENTYLSFNNRGGRNNAVTEIGDEQTKVMTIDSLLMSDPATYIKADVEGCEAEMLYGAYNTLSQSKPKLNIACYHRSGDLFKLPFMIKDANPEYKIYLRHHKYVPCWDLNLYCI